MKRNLLSLLTENPTDKELESALTESYQEAVEIEMGLRPFSIHPTKFRYGASDSTCPRLAYLKCHLHHLIPDFDVATTRKFRVGDIFHKMSDTGIEKVLWSLGGEIIKVNSFALRCFPDLFEGLNPDFVGGTPDHVLIAPKSMKLFLIDQKSANDYGFKENKRNGASIYHGIQVGTYFNGLMNSPLRPFVESGQLFICYMSKESVEIAVRKVTTSVVRDARTYWESVAAAARTDTLPPALPREKWACNYCPIFKGEKAPRDVCDGCNSLQQVVDYVEGNNTTPNPGE